MVEEVFLSWSDVLGRVCGPGVLFREGPFRSWGFDDDIVGITTEICLVGDAWSDTFRILLGSKKK